MKVANKLERINQNTDCPCDKTFKGKLIYYSLDGNVSHRVCLSLSNESIGPPQEFDKTVVMQSGIVGSVNNQLLYDAIFRLRPT
jgi:hypothetical protein